MGSQLADFWLWLEMSNLAMAVGSTWWFPLLHSLHVLSACLMLGFLLMVDLRLIGVAGVSLSISQLARDLLPWAASMFVLALLSGVLMFITRAANHVDNAAFQWKMLLLLLAGVNMLIYHGRLNRWPAARQQGRPPSRGVRLAGALSLLLWVGVMLAGRWIGHVFG